MLAFLFILGLLIGSFLNVCIYRIPQKKSLAFPGSHCPACQQALKPWHLIPVFSYAFQRGKCAYCNHKISIQYPVVELLNGCCYLLLSLRFGFQIDLFFHAFLASLLLVMAFIDYEHQLIPNGLNLALLLLAVGRLLLNRQPLTGALLDSLYGLAFGGGLLLLIAILTRGAMGGGDIKLMGALGFYFGLIDTLIIFFFSFVLGAVISLCLIGLKIKSRKDMIPFGPFIGAAALLVLFYGPELVQWYQAMWMI